MRAIAVLFLLLISAAGRAEELVPFERYLTPPERQAPAISPDGRHFVMMSARGFLLASVATPEKVRVLAKDATSYRWANDHDVVYFKGAELRRVDVRTGADRRLIAAATAFQLSPRLPDDVLVTARAEHPEYSRVSLRNGAIKKITGTSLAGRTLFDHTFRPRLALVPAAGGRAELRRREPDGSWKPWLVLTRQDVRPLEQDQLNAAGPMTFSFDDRALIGFSTAEQDTRSLVALDLTTGKRRVLATTPGADISEALLDPVTLAPQAYVKHLARREWVALDPDSPIARDLARLEAATQSFGGEQLRVESRSRDGAVWAVAIERSDYPDRFLLYRRSDSAVIDLGLASEAMTQLPMSKLRPMTFKARDGMELISYLALPHGADHPVPTIVVLHGGPGSERAALVNSPLVHFFTARGYAVFAANFRGSDGFGRAFRDAQNHEWGGALTRDVVDQAQELVKRGIADPKHIGLLGGSYGGYAILSAMTQTPDLFACGVEAAGPANLETFVAPEKPDADYDAEAEYTRLGDPRTEAGRKLLRERSPVNFADRLRAPLVILHGDLDREVPPRESAQMAEAARKAGARVAYLRFPDEGHGFDHPGNLSAFLGIAEALFGDCLGGRHGPIVDAIAQSSIQPVFGAESVPGLPEAIRARDQSRL